MDIRHIRYALTVARERNFTRASQRLNISQSAVSEQIRLLEQSLGFNLFRRTGRGVEITDTGRLFLHEAERVVNDVMNLNNVARRLRGVGVDTISLGIASGLARRFFPGLLAPDLIPADVHLEIRTAPTRLLFEQLQEDLLDIAISIEVEHDRIPAGIEVSRIAEIEMVLIARPDHNLNLTYGAVDLTSLAEAAIIFNEPSLGYGQIVRRLFEDNGLRPRLRAVIDNVETMKAAVLAGVGIAIIPSGAADAEVSLGQLVALPLHPSRKIAVSLYRAKSISSHRKRSIVDKMIGLGSHLWH